MWGGSREPFYPDEEKPESVDDYKKIASLAKNQLFLWRFGENQCNYYDYYYDYYYHYYYHYY